MVLIYKVRQIVILSTMTQKTNIANWGDLVVKLNSLINQIVEHTKSQFLFLDIPINLMEFRLLYLFEKWLDLLNSS